MSMVRVLSSGQQIQFPDDAEDGEITAFIREHEAALSRRSPTNPRVEATQPNPAEPQVPAHLQPLTTAERDRSGLGQRVVEGLASGTGATAILEMVGPQGVKDYINQYQRDRELGMVKQDMGVNVAGGIGQVAGMLVPGAGLSRAAQRVKSAVGLAPTAANRVAAALTGYVGGGAAMGALTPMEHEGDAPYTHKAEQILAGGAMGGAMKVAVPVVQGTSGYVRRFGHDLSNSYVKKDGAFNAIRETVHNLEPDLARRAALKAGVLARGGAPENTDLLVSQAMNLDTDLARRSTGVLDLTKDQASRSGLQSSKYTEQAKGLTERPRTLLKDIAGTDIAATEASDAAALSSAFESAKRSPNTVNTKKVVTAFDRELQATKSSTAVLSPTGAARVNAAGEAVLKPGSGDINPAFQHTLTDLRAKLYETDSMQDFSLKLGQAARAALPAQMGNIQVKGYANRLTGILDDLPTAGLSHSQALLQALRHDIKAKGMATDEIGRAVSSMLKMVNTGPTHLTTNAKTLIGVRGEINAAAKSSDSLHEKGILTDLKQTLDTAISASNPEFKASFAANVAGRAETRRRRVAEALLGTTQTPLRQPTPQAYIAAMEDPGFAQSVTKGFKAEPLSTHFTPDELAVLARGQRENLAVSGWNPAIQRPGGDTMASLTADKSPSFLNRQMMMVEALKRVGHKNLEPHVQAELWRLENSPKDFAKLFDEAPVTASRKAVRALIANEMVQQLGRAAVPTMAAKQY